MFPEIKLSEEQCIRISNNAADDGEHWMEESRAESLPDVESMHLDWEIDEDLKELGVTPEMMQRASFRFCENSVSLEKDLAEGKCI